MFTPGADIVRWSPPWEKPAVWPVLSVAPITIRGKSGPSNIAGARSIFVLLLPFLSSSLASLPEESTTGTLLSKSTFISSFCFWRNLDRLLGSTGLVEPIDMVTTLLCSRPCDWMSFHMISNTFACSIRSKARILTTTSFANFAVPYFWPAALEAVAVLWEYRPMEKSFPFPPSEPSCVHEKPKLAWYRF